MAIMIRQATANGVESRSVSQTDWGHSMHCNKHTSTVFGNQARTLIALVLVLQLPAVGGTRWPQFRGVNGQGIADGDTPPIEFGPARNLLWKTPLPPGHSCPCIWDDRIFLTANDKGKLQTICMDRATGKVLWRQTAPAQKLERINGTNSHGTPTPVSDGQRVYVFFGSYGLIAYDFQGNEQWRRPLPIFNVRHGTAASPILAGNRLIVNGDQEDWKSFLIAVDPANGQTLWQVPRPACFSSHTTPVYWQRDNAEEVIVAGSIRLVAYDAKDGSERWSCSGLEAISICPSPVIGDSMVFAMSYSMDEKLPTFDQLLAKADRNGDGKITPDESPKIVRDIFPIIDMNRDNLITRDEWDTNFRIFKEADNGLFALRAPDRGDVTSTHVLWKEKRGLAEVASPLYYRGRVFMVRSGGMASCFDAKTGKAFYQAKRLGADGQYYASPIAAEGKIYTASTLGVISVIEAADALNVLARNDLGESIVATPAIVDHKLYVRTAEHLWAFGK